MKTCSRCEATLPVTEFFKNCRARDGLQPRCKKCHYVYAKRWDDAHRERRKEIWRRSYVKRRVKHRETTLKWRAANVERIRSWRRKRLLATYGLTAEIFGAMLAQQRNLCAICRKPMPRVNVDHCHDTNEVRGLLCDPCNKGIGQFRDDPHRLRAAADYVERAWLRSGKRASA